MEGIYTFVERITALTLMGFVGESLLPKGNMRTSARKALALMVLAYIAEPILKVLGAG